MPGIYCAVYVFCGNKRITGNGITFHQFPIDKINLCKQRVVATKLHNFKPNKSHYLCSKHFLPEDYKFANSTRLKDVAVPSIFNFPETSSHYRPENEKKQKRKTPRKRSFVESEPSHRLEEKNFIFAHFACFTTRFAIQSQSSMCYM